MFVMTTPVYHCVWDGIIGWKREIVQTTPAERRDYNTSAYLYGDGENIAMVRPGRGWGPYLAKEQALGLGVYFPAPVFDEIPF